MTRRLNALLRRFRRDEDGTATIEFVLYFSLLFVILAAGIELAYMNLRHAMLERAVDQVVRDIRLSTGHIPSYTQVREDICDKATVIDACEDNLMLEMKQIDPRAFAGLPSDVDCISAAQEPRPVRTFQHGQDNQLMLLRACMKFKPVFPSTGLGAELEIDDDGYTHLVVTAAFVQEPR